MGLSFHLFRRELLRPIACRLRVLQEVLDVSPLLPATRPEQLDLLPSGSARCCSYSYRKYFIADHSYQFSSASNRARNCSSEQSEARRPQVAQLIERDSAVEQIEADHQTGEAEVGRQVQT